MREYGLFIDGKFVASSSGETLDSTDPSTGEVVVAGFGGVPRNMGVKPYNLGFAPRLGIAYQATPRWVIFVKAETLPIGPFLCFDRQDRLVATVYMVPTKDIEDHKSFEAPGFAGRADHLAALRAGLS